MKEKMEVAIYIIACIFAVLLGAGMAILVTEAIDRAEAEACFDYRDPEVCKEAIK